eukprot:gene7222-6816_t
MTGMLAGFNQTASHVALPLYEVGFRHSFRAIVEPDGAVAWLVCGASPPACRQEDPSVAPTSGPPCCAHILTELLLATRQ